MESLGHEVVPFEDVVCQMWDMLKLGDRTYVTLQVSLSRLMYCCRPRTAVPNFRTYIRAYRQYDQEWGGCHRELLIIGMGVGHSVAAPRSIQRFDAWQSLHFQPFPCIS